MASVVVVVFKRRHVVVARSSEHALYPWSHVRYAVDGLVLPAFGL